MPTGEWQDPSPACGTLPSTRLRGANPCWRGTSPGGMRHKTSIVLMKLQLSEVLMSRNRLCSFNPSFYQRSSNSYEIVARVR